MNLEVFVYDRRKGDKPEVNLEVDPDDASFSQFKQTLCKVCFVYFFPSFSSYGVLTIVSDPSCIVYVFAPF